MTMSLYNIWFDISKSLAEPPLTSCPVEHWMLKSVNVFLKQQEAMKIQIVKMDQTAIKQVTQIYQVFQNVISNLSNLSSSDNNMERRFLAQEREKNSLKRKGCQSCKSDDSAPKQAKRSIKENQTDPVTPSLCSWYL